MKRLVIVALVLLSVSSFGQTVQNLIDKVDINRLELTVSEFSGEQPTLVNGNEVTILNRQQANNDLAAQYIKEKFQLLDNLVVTEQEFNFNGKNIIATQTGKTNPNDIYLVCAHYDSVANYCADDNATGTAAVLEVAKILSTQCLENTIVYALWDEEEIGLRGSNFYANYAETNNLNILGVINMDMIGYDGDLPGQPGDNDFDIDVRDLHGSLSIKDDLLALLNTYTFNLNPIVVDPGTIASDHASFWSKGYPAVLVGESWETNDESIYYHSSADRLSTLDLPYFKELTKLVTAYMATKGGLLAIDNTVTTSITFISANQNGASYQWIDCDTNTLLTDETNQSFVPTENGTYAVEVTVGSCMEKSDCISFNTLNTEEFASDDFHISPNPVTNILRIQTNLKESFSVQLFNISGKLTLDKPLNNIETALDVSSLSVGTYFLKIKMNNTSKTFKIIKE